MVTRIGRCVAALALGMLLTGCGSTGSPEQASEKREGGSVVVPWPQGQKTTGGGQEVKLDGPAEHTLADLLTKPRAELAAQADECATKIKFLEQAHQEGRLPFLLLPNLRVPLAVPVLREARYSARRSFSVPPYLAEDARDTELALHLARHGDVEAARRVVDPVDADAARRIEALALGRNYPVEWTRLVGLLLHHAQLHLLTGNVDDGAKHLVSLHRQLMQLVDGKAQSSPLGAALLPRGRAILREAANAWRGTTQQDLCDQANAILGSWGPVPPVALAVEPGAARAQAERLFASQGSGKALVASSPVRVIDLLALPVPNDGVEAVVGTLDDAQRLDEVLFIYRTGQSEFSPRARDLAHFVRESLSGAEDTTPEARHRVAWQAYPLGKATCEAAVIRHDPTVGAFVRIRATASETRNSAPPEFLPRDFGAVRLDRSFEQNRRRVALHQRGDSVALKGEVLTQLFSPVKALPLARARLERRPTFDVVTRLSLSYNPGSKGNVPLAVLAGPLWALGGSARIESDNRDTRIELSWADHRTVYALRLPTGKGDSVTLEVSPRLGSAADKELAARAEQARAFDREERRARFAGRNLWTRLPRNLERVALGMTQGEVRKVLPPDFKVLKRDLADGVLVTMPGEPPSNAAAVVRELCARFDKSGRVAEIRVRYTAGPAAGGLTALVAGLVKRGGAPDNLPGPWAQVWADLPPRKPAPVLRRWQDDATLLLCQQDGFGVELCLRDCPQGYEEGVSLPPLAYLPRGPEGSVLGVPKAELLRAWKVEQPVIANGAVVLPPRAASPFDALLVWFDGDRAVRVVARHKAQGTPDAAQAGRAVVEAWGKEVRQFGWPWRQDVGEGGAPQGWTTHDDRTRVRIFWEQGNDGVRRMFTEWRELARP